MSKSLRNYPDPMEVFDSLRRRRHALVPAVVADPARRRLLGHRDRPPRHRPPGAAAAVERLVLPRPLRQRRRPPGHASAPADARPTNVLDRYVLAKTRQLVDDTTAAMDAYDLFGACAARAVVPRRADELVHPPQPPAVLGRRRRRHRHAAHRARRARAGRRAAAAVRHRGDPRRPARRAPTPAASTSPTGRRRASCRPTTSSSGRWTRSATSARRRCRCARPTAGGSASRWPR